jgi:Undecaprenyl-phosphate galactose phosphotransferase WbaP
MTPPARSAAATQEPNSIAFSAKIGYYLAPMILIVFDYGVIITALLTAKFIRGDILPEYFTTLMPFHINSVFLYFVIPGIYLAFFSYENLYSKRLPFWQSAEKIFRICTYVSVLAVMLMYLMGTADQISRLFMVFTWSISFVYLCIARYFGKRILTASGLWQKPVVIVGAGKTAELLAKTFTDDPGMGYKIVGVIEDNFEERPLVHQYPHIGTFATIEQSVAASGVQDVIIATPGLERENLLNLIYRTQPYVRSLTIVPDLFGVPLSNMSVETLFNEKMVLLKMRNNMMKSRNRILKRTFDLVASICGVIAISPILLGIAMAIYLCSPGPVHFAHQRIGAKGKTFPCYKFRSMVTNAQDILEDYLKENSVAREEWEKDFKLKNDPRVTSIGNFLRKTSLDELPQLFNVIKGEMSLVGPRPIINKEVPKYGEYIHDYYLVRPGITGYWQVSGRSDVDYDSRVQMDSWYVRNWSFWQDIVLLIKTIGVVFGRKGAY